MKTVILVGGKGTRIQNLIDVPKCLIPIGPYPILEHIMQQYYRHKQNDFILCLGYQGDEIKRHFLHYAVRTQDFRLNLVNFSEKREVEFLIGKRHETNHYIPDYTITFAETGLESSKIERLLLIEDYIGDDKHFMLTYGDGISNVDITKLIAFHEEHNKIGTITAVMPTDRFGRLSFKPYSDKIEHFFEKLDTSNWINGGFMIFNTKLFFTLLNAFKKGNEFEESFLPFLAETNELKGFTHKGYWQQMDTPKDHQILQDDYKNGAF